MKYKHIILFALFALIASVTSAQIQFTAGINYESGVPSGAPSSTGSRLRVDLASGRIYHFLPCYKWQILANQHYIGDLTPKHPSMLNYQ